MVNTERIIRDAKQYARERLTDELTRAMIKERLASDEVERQARIALFEQQKPYLETEARKEHHERFQPLQDILDQLRKPVSIIRNEYFPRSPIFVADHYEDGYSEGDDNTYYRALMVLDRNISPGRAQKLFGVYAIAQEPAKKKFINLGTNQDTKYKVGIGLHYIHPDHIMHPDMYPKTSVDYWSKVLLPAAGVKEDFEHITPERDLFAIVQGDKGGIVDFASHYGTAPSLEDVKYDLGQLIPFRPPFKQPIKLQDPRTFYAIEERFIDVLSAI